MHGEDLLRGPDRTKWTFVSYAETIGGGEGVGSLLAAVVGPCAGIDGAVGIAGCEHLPTAGLDLKTVGSCH